MSYYGNMTKNQLSAGLPHEVPPDLHQALISNPKALAAWDSISAIARNEWICWTVSVKQAKTREDHIQRTCSELAAGKRRPCCWVGCIHRTDKPVGHWAQKVLIDKN